MGEKTSDRNVTAQRGAAGVEDHLDDFAEVLKERRQFLQDMIDEANARPRLSRGLRIAIVGLTAELVTEVSAQIDMVTDMNRQMAQSYQVLLEENRVLAAQNEDLFGALLAGKTFKVQGGMQ
ncbi:hypothetical protein GMST_32870 [Geomonas silvestris]|uniref:Uncharacterized protein n=1 Tax=Geomonas silvestris TaxID=2740184 RepID=A0A6V8MLX4_9BACT|nr:hypothetical protein [Geomonas silvestris]GFO60962.1 hypothetical protein GMST_32870 [Geomonas silvestris]